MRKDYRAGPLLGLAAVLAVIAVGCAGAATATPTSAPAPTKAVTTAAVTPTTAATAGAVTPTTAVPSGTTGQGDPNAGRQLVVAKGCSGCHTIPGVPEAKGTIGPNLAGFGSRAQIAGTVPNTADNLAKWLKNPPSVKPGTQMPNLGLSDQDAANIAAFLNTLK